MEELNKNEKYCYSCYKNNILSIIKESKFTCNHDPRYTFTLQWCEKCNDFTTHKGITGKCHVCNSPFKNYYNTEEHLKQAKESATKLANKINNNNSVKFCKICGKETQHVFGGNKCSVCAGNNMNKVQNSLNEYKFCELCKMETYHISGGKICLICHNKKNGIAVPSFLCNNDVLYYYDKSILDYVPWEDYKSKFIQNINVIKASLFKDYPNFKIIPTFRTSSESWNGDNAAFQKYLQEQRIGWNVYIKFYIDGDKNSLPLVCGKSGSLLVSSGHDLLFSTIESDGPARKFLFENSLEWNCTKIAILSCISEQEAYNIEKEIQQRYNLFGS